MSLNTSHARGGVLRYSGERILIFHDGVEMGFIMESAMPHFKGNKNGRIYLTTHRVIFNSSSGKEQLQSFSMPFHTLKGLELEQPIFGANYIKGNVSAEPNGGWEGSGKIKMWFKEGGAIEFGQAMLEAGRRAQRQAANTQWSGQYQGSFSAGATASPPQPPAYSPPSGNYYQAPPPAYAPPTGQEYNFVPTSVFPDQPPANSVYMSEAPPPYPGIGPPMPQPYPQQQGYPPQQQGYPPQQNGAAGYPPQPQYPQQNGGGYPPQQAPGYPPAGYPPQQQAGYQQGPAPGYSAQPPAYYDPGQPGQVYMPAQPSAPPQGSKKED